MSIRNSGITSPEAFESINEGLYRPLTDPEEETRACVVAVEQCKAQVDRLSKQLKDLQELISWEQEVDPMGARNRRLAMASILIHGEFLTLQALAEHFMVSSNQHWDSIAKQNIFGLYYRKRY